ncbi:YfcL family protein [Providencia stuartii]|uniref:YfcL family protein n=1 Tax=Providencia stuartii TaxID=588 RepID=UPI0014950DDA|nr:YfcL family protein [Providencia stuartii]NPD42847.1 YfcL family protein [Providencia stuartii]NPD96045.1 YfcL family protein [Providencia stuartii]
MLADFETRILTKIDDMVEHASDDELFAGGYLRGHLTLAVAELEQENETSVDALYQRVEESIQQAIKEGELTPPDQVLVLGMWKSLLDDVR